MSHPNSESSESVELLELCGAARDGELSDAQIERLEQLLRSSKDLQDQYISFMRLQSHLECMLAPAAAHTSPAPHDHDDAIPATLPFFSLHRRSMRYALAASLILCVGVIASVMNMISLRNSQQPGVQIAVATLAESVDAVWEPDADHPQSALSDPQPGAQLPGGFLHLKSGTAKVVFLSGAEVTLQGPCKFGLNSEMRGYLKLGKITAYVPQKAHGFTVAGPNCAVIDLGTRFTMTVARSGGTDIAVTEGKVRIERDSGKKQEVAAGNTAWLDTLGHIELTAPPVAAAVNLTGNLIRNGSFEQHPSLTPGSNLTDAWFATGDQIDGWTIIGPGRWLLGDKFWKASEGHYCLELMHGDDLTTTAEQSIDLVPGRAYVLGFDTTARFDVLGDIQFNLDVQVRGDHGLLLDQTVNIPRPANFDQLKNPGWTHQTLRFTADSSQIVLRFQPNKKCHEYGPLIDNVSLTPDPAGSTNKP